MLTSSYIGGCLPFFLFPWEYLSPFQVKESKEGQAKRTGKMEQFSGCEEASQTDPQQSVLLTSSLRRDCKFKYRYSLQAMSVGEVSQL